MSSLCWPLGLRRRKGQGGEPKNGRNIFHWLEFSTFYGGIQLCPSKKEHHHGGAISVPSGTAIAIEMSPSCHDLCDGVFDGAVEEF